MDDALALLWQTMIDSKGLVTAQVTAALKNVNAAKELLPDSNAVMSVALHEMAGGPDVGTASRSRRPRATWRAPWPSWWGRRRGSSARGRPLRPQLRSGAFDGGLCVGVAPSSRYTKPTTSAGAAWAPGWAAPR